MGFMAFARDAELLAALTKESAWNATKANTTPRIDPYFDMQVFDATPPHRGRHGADLPSNVQGAEPILPRDVRRRDQPRIGADGLIVAAEDAGEE